MRSSKFTIQDLKDLGIIERTKKRKNKKRRNKKKKIIYVDSNTGAIIGGAKSDSSHMRGYGSTLPSNEFKNTANLNSEIQQENLKALTLYNKQANERPPETRFDNNPQQLDNLKQLMLPYIERNTQLEDKFNNIQNTISSGMGAFNNLQQKIYQLENQQPYYMIDDDAGNIATTSGSDTFNNFDSSTSVKEAAHQNEINDINTTPIKYDNNIYDNAELTPYMNDIISNIPQFESQQYVQNQNNPLIDSNTKLNESVDESPIKEPSKVDKTLYKTIRKKYNTNLKDKKTATTGISASEARTLYIGAGGNDETIFNSTRPNTILKAYRELKQKQKQK